MMVVTVPPRKRNQPGNSVYTVTTLIQDTGYFTLRGNIQFSYIRVTELCVRENVRLYNWKGFVTFLYFVFFRDYLGLYG